jgi:hypothetical protein
MMKPLSKDSSPDATGIVAEHLYLAGCFKDKIACYELLRYQV